MAHTPLPRSVGNGFLQHAQRQRIVPAGKPGLDHEDPFRIEDPFPGPDQFIQIVAGAGGRIEEFHDALRTDVARWRDQVAHREEDAQAGGIDNGEHVLPVLDEFGFALPGERVNENGNAKQFDVGRITPHVRGAHRGSGVSQAHSLFRAGIVSGEFLLLGDHGQLGMAVVRGQPVAALREKLPKSLPECRLPGELHQGAGIAEPQRSSHVGFGQVAPFKEFHGAGDGRPHGNGVHSHLIADIVRLGDRRQVGHPAVASQRVDRFVLGPFPFAPEFRIIHFRHPAAADRAAETGLGTDQVLPGERLAVDLFPALEGTLLEIPSRQDPEILGRHDRNRRAVQVEWMPAAFEVVPKAFGEFLDEFAEGSGIVQGNIILALDDHCFQLLGPHDRPHAGAPRRAVAVVHDGGKEHPPLRGGANAGHPCTGSGFPLQGGIGVMGGSAP